MTRYSYGGRDTIVGLAASDGKTVQALIAGSTITAWDSRTNGTQYTDLQTAGGVAIPGGNVVTTDETVPTFLGPDGVTQMWLSFNGAKRYLNEANLIAALLARVAALEAGGASSTPSANTALFVRKAAPTGGATDGVWPARPTSDGSIMVFWDGAPNADGSGPPTVKTGTGGMRPGDKWLSHP